MPIKCHTTRQRETFVPINLLGHKSVIDTRNWMICRRSVPRVPSLIAMASQQGLHLSAFGACKQTKPCYWQFEQHVIEKVAGMKTAFATAR